MSGAEAICELLKLDRKYSGSDNLLDRKSVV